MNNETETGDLQSQKTLTVGGWGNNLCPVNLEKKSELRAVVLYVSGRLPRGFGSAEHIYARAFPIQK